MNRRGKRIPHVWVIEMDCGKDYFPCSDAYVTKDFALEQMNLYWNVKNPMDVFRVTKYVRAK